MGKHRVLSRSSGSWRSFAIAARQLVEGYVLITRFLRYKVGREIAIFENSDVLLLGLLVFSCVFGANISLQV